VASQVPKAVAPGCDEAGAILLPYDSRTTLDRLEAAAAEDVGTTPAQTRELLLPLRMPADASFDPTLFH
jgi:hypothetical protein